MAIMSSIEAFFESATATLQSALNSVVDTALSVAAIMFQIVMFATLFG